MPWMLEPLTVKVTVTLSPARTLPEPEKLAPAASARYRSQAPQQQRRQQARQDG